MILRFAPFQLTKVSTESSCFRKSGRAGIYKSVEVVKRYEEHALLVSACRQRHGFVRVFEQAVRQASSSPPHHYFLETSNCLSPPPPFYLHPRLLSTPPNTSSNTSIIPKTVSQPAHLRRQSVCWLKLSQFGWRSNRPKPNGIPLCGLWIDLYYSDIEPRHVFRRIDWVGGVMWVGGGWTRPLCAAENERTPRHYTRTDGEWEIYKLISDETLLLRLGSHGQYFGSSPYD